MHRFKKFLISLFLLGGMTVGGCLCVNLEDATKKNEAATQICQPKATSADECDKCCREDEGTQGYSYGGKDTCTCLG